MEEILRQILTISLGSQSDNLIVLLADWETDAFKRALPENSVVKVLPNSTSYLRDLDQFLADTQPTNLLLIAPFIPSRKLPQRLRKAYPHLDLYEIALQIAMDKVPDNGSVGILVPQGFLTNRSSGELRDSIAQQDSLRHVIDFDFDFNLVVPSIPPAMKLHLIIVSKQGSLVRFFRCPEIPAQVDALGHRLLDSERQQAVLSDLRIVKKRGGGATEFGFILRDKLPVNTPWLYERHHPSYQSHLEDLEYFGAVRPLGELVDMHFGFRPAEQVNLLVTRQSGRNGIPVIEGRDIVLNQVTIEQTRYLALPEKSEPYLLQANDICLSSFLTPRQQLKAIHIHEEMLPLVTNQTVLILRPKPELDIDTAFLTAYLQSNFVVTILRAQGVALRLYPSSLAEVPVPVYDEAFRVALQDLRQAAGSMGIWQNEAVMAIDSLFEFESAKDARTHILAVGRRVRQRHLVAKQVDDLSYRLRSGLPHPLAYRWRVAETAQPSLEGYRDMLECAETAVCFLALVSLVMMRAVGEPVKYLEQMADRLTNIGHGTNFGDWVAILREVQGRKTLKKMGNVPFYEVARFLDDTHVDEALTLLSKNRNDDAHGRGPSGSEIEGKLAESLDALQKLLAATEFLTEYPVRFIETTRHDSITGVTNYTFRSIMGDHMVVGLEDGKTDRADLEAESLYLFDRDASMYLLRPYMIRQECPVCHRQEIFFLDKYEKRSDICELKSMKLGHTLTKANLSKVFQHVGLLATD